MRNAAAAIPVFAVLTFSAVLALPFLCPSRADETQSASKVTAASGADKKELWKPEDIIYAESVNPQTRISPDAKWLAWAKSTGDKEKDAQVSNLMLSSLTENKEIQLTRGSDNNGQPQWSPDTMRSRFTIWAAPWRSGC